MVIREAVWKECGKCHARQRVSDERYGCDHCRKPITLHDPKRAYLQAAIHRHAGEGTWVHFCSWSCCLAWARTVTTDYFVSLPFLSYDETTPGLRAEDFFAELAKPPKTRRALPLKREAGGVTLPVKRSRRSFAGRRDGDQLLR